MKIQPICNNSFGWEISNSMQKRGECLTKRTIYKRDNGIELIRLDIFRNNKIVSTTRELYKKFRLLKRQVFLYDSDGTKLTKEWFM